MASQETLDVVFHGTTMGTIGKVWFAQNSQRYVTMLLSQNAPNRIDIEDDVAPASVNEFIGICNGRQMNLTLDNVLDLHLLLEDWQIRPLLEAANQYIGQHPELLPERISRSISQQRSTADLEVLLRQHFVELCRDEALQAALRNLGVQLLVRVFEANDYELLRRHIHQVFPFLMSCLRDREIGRVASMLCTGLRIDDLTDEEIEELAGERNVDIDGLPREYLHLVKENRSLRRTCRELCEEMQRLRADVDELKQRPVVKCDCQEAKVVVSCSKCHKERHLVPDSAFGEGVWECRLSQSRPFDGVLAQMRKRCGGNPHSRGVVTVTSSGSVRNQCWQVLDPDWDDYFQTTNVPNSFIQIDFKQSKVLLEGYSVLFVSYAGALQEPYRPFRWVIEISDDQLTWTVVDSRLYPYSEEQNMGCFDLSMPRENRACRYVRFRQVQCANTTLHYLTLRRIEIFGRLQE